jgi:nucleolar protein 58
VEDITALQEGKIGKDLKKFLKDNIVDKGKTKESLVVVDRNLGPLRYFRTK